MTDLIVLAAGLGRRLAGATALPKWLVPVGRTCPADAHLAACAAAGIERVLVVVSPNPVTIEHHIAPWRDRLTIDVLVNDHAADRNNWYSLLVGLDAWSSDRDGDRDGDGDGVIVVNSDLYASPEWFAELLRDIAKYDETEAALAIDPARGRTDEAMKVALDPGGAVRSIGKVGIDQPDGEYVGLARWSAAGARGLRDALAGFVDEPDRVDCWYEHGIQVHLDGGARYGGVAVPSSAWVEIDDEADLHAALALAHEDHRS